MPKVSFVSYGDNRRTTFFALRYFTESRMTHFVLLESGIFFEEKAAISDPRRWHWSNDRNLYRSMKTSGTLSKLRGCQIYDFGADTVEFVTLIVRDISITEYIIIISIRDIILYLPTTSTFFPMTRRAHKLPSVIRFRLQVEPRCLLLQNSSNRFEHSARTVACVQIRALSLSLPSKDVFMR